MPATTTAINHSSPQQETQTLERLAGISSWYWQPDSKRIILNEIATEVLGISNLSLSMHDAFRCIVKEDRPFAISVLRNMLWSRYFPKFYFRIKTGERVRHIFLNGEISLMDDKNNFSCFGIIQDVTESRELAGRLKQQNKQLIEIARIQSHELRSPVATMLGLIDLLASGALSQAEQTEMLYGLKDAGNRLDEIIKAIDGQTFVSEL